MRKEINKLEYFSELLSDKKDSSYDDWFYEIAETLMNHLCLEVGKTRYRITECEIYYNDGNEINGHADPYIHFGEEQLTLGNLYLNKAGGLDLTFGNLDKKIYGGILIRGLNKIGTNFYINQITKITEELFRSLGNIITEGNGIRLRELLADEIILDERFRSPIKSQRVRLNEQIDIIYFSEKEYRYLIEPINLKHNYFGKSKILRSLFWDKGLTEKEIFDQLKYIPRKS